MGLTESEVAITKPAQVHARSLYMLWMLAWCLCGTPNSASGEYL